MAKQNKQEKQSAKEIAAVKKTLATASQTVVMREGRVVAPLSLILGGLILLSFAYFIVLNNGATGSFFERFAALQTGNKIVLCGFCVMAIVLFYLALRRMFGLVPPYFTLTPQGLKTDILETTIPWPQIEDFEINIIRNFNVGFKFYIADEYQGKLVAKRFRSTYNAHDNELTITGIGIANHTIPGATVLIRSYMEAENARQCLKTLEAADE